MIAFGETSNAFYLLSDYGGTNPQTDLMANPGFSISATSPMGRIQIGDDEATPPIAPTSVLDLQDLRFNSKVAAIYVSENSTLLLK